MIIREISRGITHIEDLGIKEFLKVVKNLSHYQLSEKVDGAQILFGIDEHGFYTSRETKGGDRVYALEQYEVSFSSTYQRSAHKLLEQVLPALRDAGLKPGDQVEAEVLYGSLPNVVPYSEDTNYLIFLRTTEGTVNIDRLKAKLDGRSLSISLESPYTPDGRSIQLREEANNWKFSRAPVIDVDLSVLDKLLSSKINEAMMYLKMPSIVNGVSNLVVETTPLNKVPEWCHSSEWKDVKALLKEEKSKVGESLSAYKLAIKEIMLDHIVRNRASQFGPLLEDNGWIEGVVLTDKFSHRMVKLVDKNTFGVIREFSWEVRNGLMEAARSTDGDLSFLGNLHVSMATALGHPELGTIQSKNYLKKFGSVNEERVSYITEGVDTSSVKDYWLNLLEQKQSDLAAKLDKYEKEKSHYRIEGAERLLASPIISTQRYSSQVDRRTKEVFASIFNQIAILSESISESNTAEDLVYLLAGKQLGKLT